MCYYMGIKVTRVQYIRLKQIEKELGALATMRLLQDGFMYGDWPVLQRRPDVEDFDIVEMHWELIPDWVNTMAEMELIRKGIDPKTGQRKIDPRTGRPMPPIPWMNATAEKLLTSPMFRDSALSRRC